MARNLLYFERCIFFRHVIRRRSLPGAAAPMLQHTIFKDDEILESPRPKRRKPLSTQGRPFVSAPFTDPPFKVDSAEERPLIELFGVQVPEASAVAALVRLLALHRILRPLGSAQPRIADLATRAK